MMRSLRKIYLGQCENIQHYRFIKKKPYNQNISVDKLCVIRIKNDDDKIFTR